MSGPAGCGSCLAWDQLTDDAGHCKAALPSATAVVIVATSIAQASRDERIQVVTAWPRTKATDWCCHLRPATPMFAPPSPLAS